ncbi:MAG: glycine dehydrogenase subunit 2 [Chloroflexi bacterium]|nr:glycine dehydrogenase subunit 2 [Chloroflexota bacterium]MYK62395.1 glycine dehydrogenase subunit 2 [Chloroflexota bacterium]
MPDRSLLMDRSVPGRKAINLPAPDVPLSEMPGDGLLRESDDLQLPEVSQLDVIRYFTLLSRLNFSIDTNFYPLGSCTMKYNPKLNDQIASLGGFANIHPLQDDDSVQGALGVMFELQQWLGEATGLPGVGLAPLAGAQGEYAGLLIARAALNMRGESHRDVALIPDSAHGTNPASAAMAGLSVVTVKTDESGNVDVDDLRAKADENTCVFMLTIPSTLGLFEPNIIEINDIVHDAGGLVYADGANLNALLGLVKLGDLGVDICHSNLHKTFSTPHGGGGPGAGPVMVTEELASYLPEPVVVKNDDGSLQLGRPGNSIGKINGFHGSFSILVRAYTYMQSLGGNGLRAVSENAVINANYVQAQLRDRFDLAVDRICMHETVLSGKRQADRGVPALSIAKRLLDYGIHAPTMYFPLIVPEALMVEPTETESKETLDRFVAVMQAIDDEIDSDPDSVNHAPHTLPNTRLDEATAARRPVLRWQG